MPESSERKYDIVVLGATGFTGERIAKFLADAYPAAELSLALAGRSEAKLEAVRSRICDEKRAKTVGVIVADCSSSASLAKMAGKARVVISAAGPYRLLGLPVVSACVQQGTHYVDVTGEPEFITRSEMQFGELAKETGAVVVHCCGFDSIPADIGLQHWAHAAAKLGLEPGRVSSYLSLNAPLGFTGHYATWQSAVLGFGAVGELRALRKEEEKMRQARGLPLKAAVSPLGQAKQRRPPRGPGFFRHAGLGAWCAPFPGSDVTVVRRSQRAIAEAKGADVVQPEYSAYFCVRSSFWKWVVSFFGLVMQLLARFSAGRWLLQRYPRVFSCGAFSHAGPTEAQLAATTFTMQFEGKAWNKATGRGTEIVTRVSGPEAGYVATPIFAGEVALTLLRGKARPAGVFTPAAALYADRDAFIDRLTKRGISFTVVKAVQDRDGGDDDGESKKSK